nr:maturase R [Comandra umbellata]
MKKEGSKFRPLTVVLPIEKIMKEAIRMVLESIYDPEFPDTSHCHSALLRRIKEWGTSRWFLEFDIRKCFHTIDRHRLIPIFIFKEEIDDPKFFYFIQKVPMDRTGRLGGEKGPYFPHSVLSAPAGGIYLHKLDQEIGRIRQKYEIPIVQRIRSVLLRTGRIDDQENSGFSPYQPHQTSSDRANNEHRASIEPYTSETPKRAIARLLGVGEMPLENRAIIVGVKSIQRLSFLHSLVSWHTPQESRSCSTLSRCIRDQKKPFVFGPSCLPFNKPIPSLIIATEFYGYNRERCNWAMRDLINKYCCCKKRKKGGEALVIFRSLTRTRGAWLARMNPSLKSHHYLTSDALRRICYARYADDSLLGIVGVELLIEIQKRIAHLLQSGLMNLWAGSTIAAARSTTVEFLGTVIQKVPMDRTPILQFLRELEKRLRVKHRIHITACLRSAIHSKFIRNNLLGNSIPIKQLTKGMMSGTGSLLDAEKLDMRRLFLGTAAGVSPQVSSGWDRFRHSTSADRLEARIGYCFKDKTSLHSSGRINPSVQQAVSRSGMSVRMSLYTPAGEGGGHWARSISSEFPIQIEAPIKKILRRLRDRGLISRRRPWPIHVACLTNVSDGDIVNWSAGIAISPLSYYRCRDNLYQVRTIVDHQIRWSAIFTPAHKHKSSARNIIPKYSKDSNIVNHKKVVRPKQSSPTAYRAWEGSSDGIRTKQSS